MKFMSGRALFTYNPDLFQDADDNEETKEDFEEIEEKDERSDNEESKQDVAVDQDLFKDEAGEDEDVDFGDE